MGCVDLKERIQGENYEMADTLFLFEFPTKHMAEHVLQGEWSWKKIKKILHGVVDSSRWMLFERD